MWGYHQPSRSIDCGFPDFLEIDESGDLNPIEKEPGMFRNRPISVLITFSLIAAFAPANSFAAGPAITTTTTAKPANTILNGKTPPIASVGKNGDFYIDVKNLMIYGPKKNGIWPLGVSLKGVDGKNGSDGKNGVDGSTITKTVTGEKGEKGATGATGATGPQGPKGDTGLTGATGATGATGLTGATGPAGAKGETGATGLTGAKGDTGATGATGAQGLQGLQGIQGIQGEVGPAGAKGETGATGPAGAAGATGPAGPSQTYNKSITFLNAMNGKSIDSNQIVSLPGNQSFTFQLILTGLTTKSVYLGMDLIAEGASYNFDYVISQSAKYDAVQLPGTGYVFTLIGTITTGDSGAAVYVRVTEQTGNLSSGPMTLSGRATFIRTETIL